MLRECVPLLEAGEISEKVIRHRQSRRLPGKGETGLCERRADFVVIEVNKFSAKCQLMRTLGDLDIIGYAVIGRIEIHGNQSCGTHGEKRPNLDGNFAGK